MKKQILAISILAVITALVFFAPRHRVPEEIPPLNYDSIFNKLTISQLYEILYNINEDTVSKKEVVEIYLASPSYYKDLDKSSDTIYLDGVTIL